MQRICPNCSHELPEEASFCLNCFTQLNIADEPDVPSFAVIGKKRSVRKPLIISACILLALTALSAAGYRRLSGIIPKSAVSEDETVLVPVTGENNEAVTDEHGEIVYQAAVPVTDAEGNTVLESVVEVTNANGEAVTDSNGEKLYETVSEAAQQNTDKKQSLLERLFGSGTQSSSAEAKTTRRASAPAATAATAAQPVSKTTAAPTTRKPTAAPTTQKPVATATQGSSASAADFNYSAGSSSVTITGYKGSSSVAVVPASISGKPVTSVSQNCFNSNSYVTKIIFEDRQSFSLPSGVTFNNMPNLKVIVLPAGTLSSFTKSTVSSCPKLEAVYFGSEGKNSSAVSGCNYSVDGVVMSASGYTSELVYYPQGKRTASYSMPDNVSVISDSAVTMNPYLKEFKLSPAVTQIKSSSQPLNFCGCTALSAFTGSGNRIHTENGVLYFLNASTVNDSKGTVKYAHVYYPAGKTDSYFEFTKGYPVQLLPGCFAGNPYLQTAKFFTPTYTGFGDNFMKASYKPTALKKIIIPDSGYSGTGGDYLKLYITVEKY